MTIRAVLDAPEVNVVIFALLLNYPWEILQAPFYEGMMGSTHWDAVKVCSMATLGDGVIALVSFWTVAAFARSRRWILDPSVGQLIGFIAAGVGVTAAIELLATGPLDRWTYADTMPVVLGVALAPLLQWLVLPPLLVWFVRRQLGAR